MTQYFIGIDPDLHHAGVALFSDKDPRKPIGTWVAVTPIDMKQEAATAALGKSFVEIFREEVFHGKGSYTLVVESQRIRPGSKVRAQDIAMLCQAAGVAAGVAYAMVLPDRIVLPAPEAWKGQIPKEQFTQMVIDWLSSPNYAALMQRHTKSHLSHVVDACGLALWGMVTVGLHGPSALASQTQMRGNVLTPERLRRLARRTE